MLYPFTVHEGTLVHTLSQLARWCAKLTTTVPEKLGLWFKVSSLLIYLCNFDSNGDNEAHQKKVLALL